MKLLVGEAGALESAGDAMLVAYSEKVEEWGGDEDGDCPNDQREHEAVAVAETTLTGEH